MPMTSSERRKVLSGAANSAVMAARAARCWKTEGVHAPPSRDQLAALETQHAWRDAPSTGSCVATTGDADLMEGAEDVEDVGGRSRVEVRRRFVGKQDGGRLTTARAIARRCCSPPRGDRLLFAFEQADLVEARRAPARALQRCGRPTMASGSSTLSSTLRSNSSFWS